jgi:hypothetical protein
MDFYHALIKNSRRWNPAGILLESCWNPAGILLGAGFASSAFAVPVTINLAPNNEGYVSSFNYTSTEANVTVTG